MVHGAWGGNGGDGRCRLVRMPPPTSWPPIHHHGLDSGARFASHTAIAVLANGGRGRNGGVEGEGMRRQEGKREPGGTTHRSGRLTAPRSAWSGLAITRLEFMAAKERPRDSICPCLLPCAGIAASKLDQKASRSVIRRVQSRSWIRSTSSRSLVLRSFRWS